MSASTLEDSAAPTEAMPTSATPATFTFGNNLAGQQSLFAGAITGSTSIVTRGTNTITLSGTSTYTGTTTVGGTLLRVNGSLGNTAVTVSAGTLGGSGSIAGSVAVQGGARLAPGNSIESLAAGATSFASGATYAYEVDSTNLGSLGTAADLLVVTGNLDIASGSLLALTDLAATVQPFVQDTTVFAMVNYTGTWNGGLFTSNGTPLADGADFLVGNQWWRIDYDSSAGGLNYTGDYQPSSSFVTITAVPEPATLALFAAAAGLAALARRRR